MVIVDDTLLYTVDREVEDIAALINEIDESVLLFGMFSGDFLALEAVVQCIILKNWHYTNPSILTRKLN